MPSKQEEFKQYVDSKLWDKANHMLQHESSAINLAEYLKPGATYLQNIIVESYGAYITAINNWNSKFDTLDPEDVHNYGLKEERETFNHAENPLVLFIKLLIRNGLDLQVKVKKNMTAEACLKKLSPKLFYQELQIPLWLDVRPTRYPSDSSQRFLAFCYANNKNRKHQLIKNDLPSLTKPITINDLPPLTEEMCMNIAEFLMGKLMVKRLAFKLKT